ncbi:hypothetical protein BDY21DRAFT_331414 [Lineolata rhizophorae]|uniref:Trafficking protein particle complex subunit 10 n=1 Tax=Lineolata rhizophorae TaxID=578093 RepID=A0A6A6PEJ4_9PEZI|nr:hypothetical protein BDY21DRAFT_331414 [Lineolata rhizophorae]
MDGQSTSKVTVEYHDPSGVYPVLAPLLSSRLPLRNLHWKSPTRPLRSIDSLHVELLPSGAHLSSSLKRTASGSAVPGSTSVESRQEPRRHQIPGLRRTPYLKVFLLRCDDSESYKSTARKQVREWVRAHTASASQASSSSSSLPAGSKAGQENHDAFEWLVLHVVFPDTPAAAQPRWSGSGSGKGGDAGGVERPSSGPKWPGKSSSTILEKLRADFNVSSKSAPDRVAQVRIPKSVLTGEAPAQAQAQGQQQGGGLRPPSTANEDLHEQEASWNDVVAKLKTLILQSFDLRVRQYEEDIREKDAQRALPGWNFCTFFMLKEGLARGFESVGLVEDALIGYDELAIGLDSVIRDLAMGSASGQATSFLEHTEDLQQLFRKLREEGTDISIEEGRNDGPYTTGSSDLAPFDEDLINPSRKNYRDLIMANNISIFDFRCYIFARQLQLLLRLGNPRSASKSQLMAKLSEPSPSNLRARGSVDDLKIGTKAQQQHQHPSDEAEDLLSLAELCRRATSFVTSTSRVLKEDLACGFSAPSDDASLDSSDITLIASIASSWLFSVSQQVLEATSTPSLPISSFAAHPSTSSSAKLLSAHKSSRGHEPKSGPSPGSAANQPEPKTMLHPARSSSLSHRRSSGSGGFDPPYAVTPPSGQIIYEQPRPGSTPPAGPISPPGAVGGGARTGLDELAAHRAELLLLQRRVIKETGGKAGWWIGWDAVVRMGGGVVGDGEFEEIDLGRSGEESEREEEDEDKGADKEGKEQSRVHEGTETTLEGKAWAKGLCNTRLRAAAASTNDFRAQYAQLSELVVKHFAAAGRSRAEEAVLADLAAVKFEMGDYAGAAMYFSRAVPAYAEKRWTRVEVAMLKLHAQCLKKLHRRDEYVRVMLHLLSKSAARAKAERKARWWGRGSIAKDEDAAAEKEKGPEDDDISRWLDDGHITTAGYLTELVECSAGLPYDMMVPMSQYFADTTVDPHIRHVPGRDGFRLLLRFTHLLEDDLLVNKVKLRLARMDGAAPSAGGNSSQQPQPGREIWLDGPDAPLNVRRGSVRVWLDSNVSTVGQFYVDKIVLEAGKIVFVHEPHPRPSDPASAAGSMSQQLSASSNAPAADPAGPRVPRSARVWCFPNPDALAVKVALSRFIHIDRPRSLDVEVKTGHNDVGKLELRLRAASAGLRLRTANVEMVSVTREGNEKEENVVDGVEMGDRGKPGIIEVLSLPAGCTARLKVPYELETSLRDLGVRVEATYNAATKGGAEERAEFVFVAHSVIPVELPLDVNVHDLFKARVLFQRFHIHTAGSLPLEIVRSQLEGTRLYDVQSPPCGTDESMIIFPKQPATLVYRIEKRDVSSGGGKVGKEEADQPLQLTVDYRCVDETVLTGVEALFSSAVEQAPAARPLTHLLVPVFRERFKAWIKPTAYEQIALLERVKLPSFAEMAWADVLESVPADMRQLPLAFLEKWHKDHPVVTFSPDIAPRKRRRPAPPPPDPRRIVITVAVPHVHVVHTASLELHLSSPQPSPTSAQPRIIPVAVGVPATLRIKYTRRWGSLLATQQRADGALPFVFDVLAQPDLWLVGGSRRATFEAKEGEEVAFELLLVPLRPGPALLPGVEVRAAPRRRPAPAPPPKGDGGGGMSSGAQAEEEDEAIACETEYKSQGMTVLVVPDVRSTSVVMLGRERAADSGGVVLVGDERRGKVEGVV